MKKSIAAFLLLFASYSSFLHPIEVPAANTYAVTDSILDSAESFFTLLKKRSYEAAWDLLSTKSKDAIITKVYKASKDAGEGLEKNAVESDFKKKGPMFKAYWDAFLIEFDPDMVLEESRWEMGTIEKNSAEIILLHKKSEHPAILHMFRENGSWKVGFWETFSTRKF